MGGTDSGSRLSLLLSVDMIRKKVELEIESSSGYSSPLQRLLEYLLPERLSSSLYALISFMGASNSAMICSKRVYTPPNNICLYYITLWVYVKCRLTGDHDNYEKRYNKIIVN